MAALFRRQEARGRSRQLELALSCPLTNHLANGAFDQSRTWVNGLNQSSDLACSAQKPSGSVSAHLASRSRSAALTRALAANSGGGGKRRVSFRTLVMFGEGGDMV